jgi:hypothetical protein
MRFGEVSFGREIFGGLWAIGENNVAAVLKVCTPKPFNQRLGFLEGLATGKPGHGSLTLNQ